MAAAAYLTTQDGLELTIVVLAGISIQDLALPLIGRIGGDKSSRQYVKVTSLGRCALLGVDKCPSQQHWMAHAKLRKSH